MLDENGIVLTTTDLKQFIYCPRILYYHGCLPDVRPVTYKMKAGIKRHEDEHKRALRRNMNLPDIADAQRLFDIQVQSTELGLNGQIDEVLLYDDRIIVVDYKLAKTVGRHFKLQLAAYTMLAEAHYHLPAKEGLLYLIRKRETVHVKITTRLRNEVRSALAEMRAIIDQERMPPPANNRRACTDCEFRRFCNDV